MRKETSVNLISVTNLRFALAIQGKRERERERKRGEKTKELSVGLASFWTAVLETSEYERSMHLTRLRCVVVRLTKNFGSRFLRSGLSTLTASVV
jgi:hypothetical protein